MNIKTIQKLTLVILLGLFLTACNTNPALGAETQPVSAATATEAIALATDEPIQEAPTATDAPEPEPVASVDGGMSANLALSNLSDRNLEVYWMDFNGAEQFTKRLTAGQAYTQETFVGHFWRVRDEATGQEIETFEVKSRETNKPIIVPASIAAQPTAVPTPTPLPVLVDNADGCVITDPGHSYFGKECSLDGIKIRASDAVQDKALEQAWYIISNMLASRPDVKEQLSNRGVSVLIFPAGKDVYDLPVNIGTDDAYAVADNDGNPMAITGENNLLCQGGWQEFLGYNVLVHEFAHSFHFVGINSIEPTFDGSLSRLYSNAIASGMWPGHYVNKDRFEYWAEGVTMYFDASPTNYNNFYVNTKAELQEYDPDLYNLIAETFRGLEWSPVCP